mgnify:CR=1 FL=1
MWATLTFSPAGLNEVQLPKKLQRALAAVLGVTQVASMKCSSRRNCNPSRCRGPRGVEGLNEVQLPKKLQHLGDRYALPVLTGLNEVQFPKELQHVPHNVGAGVRPASMKCSSPRNCNLR